MAEENFIAAKAPSNIALVKYMGKTDVSRNLPANPSLSMTLSRFCTVAELSGLEYGDTPGASSISTKSARWIAEPPRYASPDPELPFTAPEDSPKTAARIDAFIARLSRELPPVFARFDLPFRPLRAFELRTANTFPPATGLASSASAFAAMTLAFARAQCGSPERFRECLDKSEPFRAALASVSRLGSGSSCRSFLGPWVVWREEAVAAVPSKLPPLADLVLLVTATPKTVSSSEAHKRVATSPAWRERVATATRRTMELERAILGGDLDAVRRISWQDCWDMHHLFHTSDPPFTYWETRTFDCLRRLMQDPALGAASLTRPVVTLDAGPNLHLLVPVAEREAWRERLGREFADLKCLVDEQGKGARLLDD